MPIPVSRKTVASLLLLMLAVTVSACSPARYREMADQEVYAILAGVHQRLYGSPEMDVITGMTRNPFDGLPPAEAPLLETPPGLTLPDGSPRILSLEKALEISGYNSREFQTRKEETYLAALDLTDARYAFSPQFSALVSGSWDRFAEEESVSLRGEGGVTRLLRTGAQVGLNLSTEFLRFLTGDPRRTASSILAVTLLQPLWRGSGEAVTTEDLTQAERNVVYAVRDLSRFRKTLSVSVATSFYQILQQRAVTRNEQGNFERLTLASERADMLAKAGRLPEFEADQARQDALRARDRWLQSATLYYDQLDRFKILLGLPADALVDLDDADLVRLRDLGIRHPDDSLERAVAQALTWREDLRNTADRVVDAERRVAVAADDLRPGLDLLVDARVPTDGETRAERFRFDRTDITAGLDLDLPLSRLSERNAYRASLILLARSQRDYEAFMDQVKTEVREAWRALQEARASYEIQSRSVDLARRRVDSTTLLLQAGRASTRDLLEAQAALVEAENAAIGALTNHAIARMAFYRDTGAPDPVRLHQ